MKLAPRYKKVFYSNLYKDSFIFGSKGLSCLCGVALVEEYWAVPYVIFLGSILKWSSVSRFSLTIGTTGMWIVGALRLVQLQEDRAVTDRFCTTERSLSMTSVQDLLAILLDKLGKLKTKQHKFSMEEEKKFNASLTVSQDSWFSDDKVIKGNDKKETDYQTLTFKLLCVVNFPIIKNLILPLIPINSFQGWKVPLSWWLARRFNCKGWPFR